jgi:hypothetical protein
LFGHGPVNAQDVLRGRVSGRKRWKSQRSVF